MELLWLLYMYFAPIAYMLGYFIKILLGILAITIVLIIIALVKTESEEHTMKVLYYRVLSMLYPKKYKMMWDIKISNGIDKAYEVTGVQNMKTGVVKILRARYINGKQ